MAIEITATERKKIRKDARYIVALAEYEKTLAYARDLDAVVEAAYDAMTSFDAEKNAAIVAAKAAYADYQQVVKAASKKVHNMMIYGIFE